MEMTKEAMEYLVSLSAPQVIEVNGETYSKDRLNRISFIPKAEALKLHTLTSLVEYIKSKTDGMDLAMLVHVESPTKVLLYSSLDEDRGRECLVEVNAELPYIGFNKYIDQEEFLIGMQANFLPGKDRDLLLKFAGTVEDKSVAEYGDDGIHILGDDIDYVVADDGGLRVFDQGVLIGQIGRPGVEEILLAALDAIAHGVHVALGDLSNEYLGRLHVHERDVEAVIDEERGVDAVEGLELGVAA